MINFKIDNEFRDLLPPLTKEEYGELEKSLLEHGLVDSLKIWTDIKNEETYLVDGHNRYEICTKHNIPIGHWQVQQLSNKHETKEDVIKWILDNQLGRRNLSVAQRFEIVQKYKPLFETKAKQNMADGGKGSTTLPKVDTRKEMAKIVGTSEGTYSKLGKIFESDNEEIKEKVKSGDITVNKAFKEINQDKQIIEKKSDKNNLPLKSQISLDAFEETEQLSHEITARNGYFINEFSSNLGDFDLNPIGILLCERLVNNEITWEQFTNTITKHKIEFPIMHNKKLMKKFYYETKISTNYSKYNCETNKSTFTVIEKDEFRYDDLFQSVDNECSDDFKSLTTEQHEITLVFQYGIYGDAYCTAYKDKELIGAYNITSPYDTKQFKSKMIDSDGLSRLRINIFLALSFEDLYLDDRFKDYKKLWEDFKQGLINIYNREESQRIKKEKEEEKRQEEEQKRKEEETKRKYSQESKYWNYDFSGMLDSKSTFNDLEKQMLKRMYKKMAVECHPDHGGKMEDMQVLNALKDKLSL